MLHSRASSGAVVAATSRNSLLGFLYQTRTILGTTYTHKAGIQRTYTARRQDSTKGIESFEGDEAPKEFRQRIDERRLHDLEETDNELHRIPDPRGRREYTHTKRPGWAAFNHQDNRGHQDNTRSKNSDWKENRLRIGTSGFMQYNDEIVDFNRFKGTTQTSQPQTEIENSRGQDAFDDHAELEKELSAESRSTKESTITHAERQTFQRIFKDILARSKQSGEQNPSITPMDGQAKLGMSPSSKTNETGKAVKVKRQGLSLVADQNVKAEAIKKAIERYPAPLRAAAAKALGLASEKATLKDFETKAPTQEAQDMVDELEPLRQPERERVEALMRAAKTDFELWDIMEQEVFSLVGKLDIDNLGDGNPPESAKSRRRKEKKNGAPKGAGKTPTHLPDGVPPLAFLGPLYPSHLLLGLRLLDRSFNKSSPLILNILPRIKALGLISHVLGASSALYNELLRIYWTRYDNFSGVLKLLEEMEDAGLDLDGDTLDAVMDIRKMQWKVKRGEKGLAMQELWSLPGFASDKFLAWQKKIQAAMEDRARDLARVV